MPKSAKSKVTKKQEKAIHPNSRKASQLHRAEKKTERKEKRNDERSEKDKHLWEKVCWFKEQLVEGKDRYSVIEVCDLISKYINRFQERKKEIEESKILNKQLGRHGLTNAAEESAMQMVYDKEEGMFESGHFEAPDLTNRKIVKVMKEMNDIKEMQNVKMRKFKKQQPGQEQQQEQQETGEMEVEDGEDDDSVGEGGDDEEEVDESTEDETTKPGDVDR